MDLDKEQAINELRLLSLSASTLLPLLETRRTEALDSLMAKFRQGDTDLVIPVAEIHAYITLIEDIQNKLNTYEHLSKET